MSTTPVTPDPSQAQQQAPATPPSGNGGTPVVPTPQQPTSRLGAVLSAVAKTVSTGLSGIPESRRPSFVTGLGEGARANQAAQATQNAIKFKTFDDQVRLAELHNQDLKMQNDTQEQQDAHIKADLDNRALANSLGVDYDTIANHGSAVMDHLAAQTQANGSASVPPGTHLSGDGKTVQIPQNTQATRDGQKEMYNQLAPALGLPALPPGAQFVPPKNLNMLTNKIHGFDINGEPIKHDDLPAYISSAQTQRDALAKNGASDAQLKAVDNMIGIYKANLTAADEHAESVRQKQKADDLALQTSPDVVNAEGNKAASIEQKKLDVQNAPANQQKAAQGAALKAAAEQKIKNAVDENGNPVWAKGATADERKKAELAENMVFNANNVASILQRRPDLVGVIAGRYTTVQQMAGSNDPDIVAIGTDIHNIGMANGGIHGMRSPQQAEDYANQVLNHFKNGPKGIYGGLKSSADSVQTFIDAARPSTYKTHSSQGGAIRAMQPTQGGQ